MDLVFRPADCVELLGCALGLNAGDDLIGTRIDDDSANDLLIAGSEAAPFTGDWFPVHNSPEWDFEDPVGQLSHFGGLGTRGEWQLFVADHEIFDEGSLEAWSLVVTPVEYACDCAPGNPGVFAIPGEIGGLAFLADGATLVWDSDAGGSGTGTGYDLLRGALDELPPGSGGGESCLAQAVLGTSAQDSATPAAGSGFYYLVRGTNSCGDGSWGTASGGGERSSGVCP